MESKNEFTKVDFKNYMCYYWDHILRVIDIRDNLLEKKRGILLIYENSYKTFMGLIPLHIRLDEIDGFIKVYDGSRYLVLFSNSMIE